MTSRPNQRETNQIRPLALTLGYQKFAEGSTLIEMGDTRVLTAASVEKRVPPFLLDKGQGWVTAEYSMLPRATHTRNFREVSRGKPSGRTSEIQRLIGRSLRASIDLRDLEGYSITLDCDVLQADGGTRCASITGAYISMVQAIAKLYFRGELLRWPRLRPIAAISVGLLGKKTLLDLEYIEDRDAEVDFNVVATHDGEFVEVQGTAEEKPFSRERLDELLDLAMEGIVQLGQHQNEVLKSTLEEVESLKKKGRKLVAPKSEDNLWKRPKKRKR